MRKLLYIYIEDWPNLSYCGIKQFTNYGIVLERIDLGSLIQKKKRATNYTIVDPKN